MYYHERFDVVFDLLGSSSRNLRQMAGVPAGRFMKNLRDSI